VFQILFHTLKSVYIAIAHQTEGLSCLSRSTCATNSMHVIFRIIWQFKIQNQIHAQNIETTCRQICGHQNITIAIAFELLHHAIALGLSEQT
jgi:hypothetical protein